MFSFSAPLILYGANFHIPKLWAYLGGNVVTQYVCIRSVYILTSECTSLTVTLVVTLRKFMSLMFSIFYFQNPFTVYHWIGTVLVFGGTLIFVELASKIRQAIMPEKETKIDWSWLFSVLSLRWTDQEEDDSKNTEREGDGTVWYGMLWLESCKCVMILMMCNAFLSTVGARLHTVAGTSGSTTMAVVATRLLFPPLPLPLQLPPPPFLFNGRCVTTQIRKLYAIFLENIAHINNSRDAKRRKPNLNHSPRETRMDSRAGASQARKLVLLQCSWLTNNPLHLWGVWLVYSSAMNVVTQKHCLLTVCLLVTLVYRNSNSW